MKIALAVLSLTIALAVAGHARFAGVAYAQTPTAADGQALFTKAGCPKCHQVAGKGNKMFPLDKVGGKLTAAEMRLWLTKPAEMEAKLPKPPTLKMSAQKYNFKAAEIDALLAYLQSLK
jgi:cytochrome c2